MDSPFKLKKINNKKIKEGEVKRNKSNTLEGKIIKKDNRNFTDRNKVTFKGTEVTCRVARKTMNVCNIFVQQVSPAAISSSLYPQLHFLNLKHES